MLKLETFIFQAEDDWKRHTHTQTHIHAHSNACALWERAFLMTILSSFFAQTDYASITAVFAPAGAGESSVMATAS